MAGVCRLPRDGAAVTAPAVLRAARKHFGCPSAARVPLEQDGGPAVAGSHWEASMFGNELMVGRPSSGERLVLSMARAPLQVVPVSCEFSVWRAHSGSLFALRMRPVNGSRGPVGVTACACARSRSLATSFSRR